MATKPEAGKKFKNGARRKSWRKGKKIAIYMDGSWHHFGDAKMSDFRKHRSAKRKKAYHARHKKNTKGNSPRAKAFRKYNSITWENGGHVTILANNGFTIKTDGSIVDPDGNIVGNTNNGDDVRLSQIIKDRNKDATISTEPIQANTTLNPVVSNTPSTIPNLTLNSAKQPFTGLSDLKGELKSFGNDLRIPIGLVGAGIQAGANIDESDINIGQSVLGGSLQGIAQGGIAGGVLGGLSGLLGSVNRKSNFEESRRRQESIDLQNSTVNPSTGVFEEGGVVEGGELVPVQTEKGESLLLPDGTFTNTLANKKHSNLEKGQPTDFIPEGTSIFSEKNKLDPSKLTDEENLLGYDRKEYIEGKDTGEVKKILFTDLIGSKKLSFSDAAKRIAKQYPINTENDKDIITMKTNERNLENRQGLFEKLLQLQSFQTDKSKSRQAVPEFEGGTPGLYLADDNLFNNLFDETISDIDKLQGENVSEFNTTQRELGQLGRSSFMGGNLSAISNIAGILGQSPVEDPVLKDSSFADLAFKQVPNSLIDDQISRLRAGSDRQSANLLNSGVDPRLVTSLTANSQDAAFNAEATLRGGLIRDRIKTDRDRGSVLQDVRNFNNASRTIAGNQQRTNTNQQISNLSSAVSTGIESGTQSRITDINNSRLARSQFNSVKNTLEESRRQARAKKANFNAMDSFMRARLLGILPNQGGQTQNTEQGLNLEEFNFDGLVDQIYGQDV